MILKAELEPDRVDYPVRARRALGRHGRGDRRAEARPAHARCRVARSRVAPSGWPRPRGWAIHPGSKRAGTRLAIPNPSVPAAPSGPAGRPTTQGLGRHAPLRSVIAPRSSSRAHRGPVQEEERVREYELNVIMQPEISDEGSQSLFDRLDGISESIPKCPILS